MPNLLIYIYLYCEPPHMLPPYYPFFPLINHYFYKKLILYIQIPNIFLGLGFEFEFGPQRIRDLAIVCPWFWVTSAFLSMQLCLASFEPSSWVNHLIPVRFLGSNMIKVCKFNSNVRIYKGSFNNYGDQILPNFDPLQPLKWTLHIIPSLFHMTKRGLSTDPFPSPSSCPRMYLIDNI